MTTVVTYRLTLEQPLLATSLEGDPNSSRSYDYIPGGQIRGLLIHRLRATSGAPADLLADADVQRRFFSGDARFLHAYPIPVGDAARRSLPAPLGLHALKGTKEDSSFSALNAADPAGATLLKAKQERWPALGSWFCAPADASTLIRVRPPHTVAIHIQRNRIYGRARAGSGEVFRYDALDAGLRFAGAIVCEQADDAAALYDLLAADAVAWVGRSRSAGYGRVRIVVDKPRTGWREVTGPPPAPADRVTMTLLSDLLLRDTQGRELVIPDDDALSAALGFTATVDLAHTFSDTALVSSYNTTARLPSPQRHALRAGSVITLHLPAPVASAALAAIEDRGLGERRAEGFGRVAFGWLTAPELAVRDLEPTKARPGASDQSLAPTSARIAGLMAKRRFAEEIDVAIGIFVRDHMPDSTALAWMPANSQLGRVRVLIRRALPTGDVAAVRAGLEDMRDAGYEQFARAPLAGGSLYDWLTDLLADPSTLDTAPVWVALKLAPGDCTVAGTHVPLDRALAGATALRLAEAVLSAVARERRREVPV